MNSFRIVTVGVLVAITGLLPGCSKTGDKDADEDQGDKPVTGQSRVEHSPHGETVVNLDEKTQGLIGLKTAALEAVTISPELKGYGQILDSTSLIQLASAVASARASLDASSKDYERQKMLLEQGQNTSARAVQAAEAAMKRDRIAVEASQAELMGSWGPSLAKRPDLFSLVDSLSRLNTLLIRLDLPAGELTAETPLGARILPPGTNPPIPASFLGQATTTEPKVQGQGFLLLATNPPERLAPGLVMAGFLQMPGEPAKGVVVPEAATVQTDGQLWAYVQTGSTTFTRRRISQEHPVFKGWFMASGFQPNERVVVTGAQNLLSEERKSEIKVGD